MEANVHQALNTHPREIHREKQLYFQRAAIEAHAFARIKRCRKNHEKSRAKANALEKMSEISKLMLPIASMYGIFTYIWLIFMVNVGKYTIPMDAMS